MEEKDDDVGTDQPSRSWKLMGKGKSLVSLEVEVQVIVIRGRPLPRKYLLSYHR